MLSPQRSAEQAPWWQVALRGFFGGEVPVENGGKTGKPKERRGFCFEIMKFLDFWDFLEDEPLKWKVPTHKPTYGFETMVS